MADFSMGIAEELFLLADLLGGIFAEKAHHISSVSETEFQIVFAHLKRLS